jgi:MFS transporter, SP family, solute carrier family 2 (myo-inositol transporter), member 13
MGSMFQWELVAKFLSSGKRVNPWASGDWGRSDSKMSKRLSTQAYGRFVLSVAGLGGLLYGVDLGIIAAALLYLDKTISLTVAQTSLLVAAVLGGSMVSSLIAGLLADWLGRKKMMIVSGLMFVASVCLIVISQGFTTLLAGRLLQGMSGGVIAVVIPLYLAESLRPESRGKGTAIFQLMVTFGVLVASIAGWFYTQHAEAAIVAAHGDPVLIRAAQSHAWRSMFLAMVYPGIVFFAGTLPLAESPRWLFRKARKSDAMTSLLRLCTPQEAEMQLREMESLACESAPTSTHAHDSLLQSKYIFPFILACVILACTQATGINSILGFLVVILKQAGMSPTHATLGDFAVKLIHFLITFLAVALIDRKGRTFLLKLGTGGIVCSLVAVAILFYSFESKRIDVREQIQQARQGNTLIVPVSASMFDHKPFDHKSGIQPMALTVLYSYGDGERVATAVSSDQPAVLTVVPQGKDAGMPLAIKRASYGPIATETTGWLIALCLGLFVCFYSLGPGVVVWLALSELMPTRIRSTGMGVALVLNQGVSTLIASFFLPVVGNYGFYAMFLFWAGCTTLYFFTSAFFLPETKGRTLEEIEEIFDRDRRRKYSSDSRVATS